MAAQPGTAAGTGAAANAAAAARPAAAEEMEREAAPENKAAAQQTSQALAPAPHAAEDDDAPLFGPRVARLPVEVDVAVPVREFRVRHLLALEPGALIQSQWNHGSDVPLAARDVQLAWSEFEVVENKLAVRVTRLA